MTGRPAFSATGGHKTPAGGYTAVVAPPIPPPIRPLRRRGTVSDPPPMAAGAGAASGPELTRNTE
ncbi:hypothetical protein P73_1553 [Celeribacter indicus]|uniref:Uncharacterized protein n=1 Tax=Celeribacter indicus TaxID=1208324 RepID=A0A0B5DRW6_9RHOB|nr:hypothetical protein P73_1553 [Celeribacter indicus]